MKIRDGPINWEVRPSDNLADPNEMNASVQRFVIQTTERLALDMLATQPIVVEYVFTAIGSILPDTIVQHTEAILQKPGDPCH